MIVIRRKDIFKTMSNYTLVLDESSYIKNPTSKRTKFILHMNPTNIVLLSGTPCGGKYEELWTQCKLLDWNISKAEFYRQFVKTRKMDIGGFKIDIVTGYRNVERLKRRLSEYGAVFMKTDEVFTLPDQIDHFIELKEPKELKQFKKDDYIKIGDMELMGDTSLNKLLCQRKLTSIFHEQKKDKLSEMIQSTNDRLIIFYNFEGEFNLIKSICDKLKRPVSYVNGRGKNLDHYETDSDSVTLIQYQSGSMGLNLQKANKIIYYSLTLSSEMYEQSRKRTNRIGQSKTCHYYHLLTTNSIEIKIMDCLKQRRDFTNELFN